MWVKFATDDTSADSVDKSNPRARRLIGKKGLPQAESGDIARNGD